MYYAKCLHPLYQGLYSANGSIFSIGSIPRNSIKHFFFKNLNMTFQKKKMYIFLKGIRLESYERNSSYFSSLWCKGVYREFNKNRILKKYMYIRSVCVQQAHCVVWIIITIKKKKQYYFHKFAVTKVQIYVDNIFIVISFTIMRTFFK